MRMSTGTQKERQAAYGLASECGCDPRTALAWLRGEKVRPIAEYALEAAATRLKIDRDKLGAE